MKAFAVLLTITAMLAGCKTTQPTITRCPECWWLVTPYATFVEDGKTITGWYCLSGSCGWWGFTTNNPQKKTFNQVLTGFHKKD